MAQLPLLKEAMRTVADNFGASMAGIPLANTAEEKLGERLKHSKNAVSLQRRRGRLALMWLAKALQKTLPSCLMREGRPKRCDER